MYLKSLTLKGFKSFGSTVTMSLEPGVTCVVGPNGSGKSNVVDALAWVMGEQGAKNLRGGQMSDVIFAGTKTKPALGRAEVQLTIDNTDGSLPIEYSEVTLARTMFRSGGSEYAINGTPVRLLDIQELLSDTGMGREMHVIVGQGQLDRILAASEMERRALIEEAAGVLKHRQRKDKALRKLDSLAVNLARVQDLTNEVGKRLGPLGKQAEAAKKAARVQAELIDATARLFADKVTQLKEKNQAQAASKEQIAKQIEVLDEKIAVLNREMSGAKTSFDEVSPQLENLTQSWAELNQIAQKLDSMRTVALERVASADEVAASSAAAVDTGELEERLAQAREEAARIAEECGKKEAAALTAKDKETAAQEREAGVRAKIQEAAREQADRREVLERLRGAVATATSLAQESAATLEKLRDVMQAASQREEHSLRELQELTAQLPAETQDDAVAKQVEKLSARVAHLQTEIANLTEESTQARTQAAHWAAKRDTLAQTLEPADATAVVSKAGISGIKAALPQTIAIESGWEEAIGAVFGAFAGAVLASGIESAADAVRYVRDQGAGQIYLLVEGKASRSASQAQRGELPASARWALDLVRARAGHKLPPVVTEILDGVAACESLAVARDIVADGKARLAVTQDGDSLSASRVIGGGDPASEILRRAAEYDLAAQEAADAGEAYEKSATALAGVREELDKAREAQEAAAAELRSQDAAAAQMAARLAGAKEKHAAAVAEAQRARDNLAQAEAESQARADRLAAAQQELEQTAQRLAEGGETQPDYDAELSAASQDLATAQNEKSDAQVAAQVAREQLKSAQARVESLQQNIEAQKAAAQAARERAEMLAQRRRRAEYVAAQAELASKLAHTAALRAETLRQTEQANREELGTRIERLRAALEDLQNQRGDLNNASMRDQIVLAEVSSKLEGVLEQVRSECGLEEAALLADYGPHNLVPVFDDAGETIEHVPYVREEQVQRQASAKAELKRIGKVNPLALQEHEALVARHKFLADQLNDLKKSRDDLLNVVDEVNNRVEEVFGAAFADVAAAFSDIFQVLFPGGQGKLELSDPKDLLNTGIDIVARPAGKNVKRMSLLSGGERSLAALAFLFAIFQARPSPFYVLDEVEAALDDVNLSRLLGVFEILRQNSQLIIITHHKRTMEIADALYGVTMREGTTTVISQRLQHEAQRVGATDKSLK